MAADLLHCYTSNFPRILCVLEQGASPPAPRPLRGRMQLWGPPPAKAPRGEGSSCPGCQVPAFSSPPGGAEAGRRAGASCSTRTQAPGLSPNTSPATPKALAWADFPGPGVLTPPLFSFQSDNESTDTMPQVLRDSASDTLSRPCLLTGRTFLSLSKTPALQFRSLGFQDGCFLSPEIQKAS